MGSGSGSVVVCRWTFQLDKVPRAEWGKSNITGFRNDKVEGPHKTIGLNKVSLPSKVTKELYYTGCQSKKHDVKKRLAWKFEILQFKPFLDLLLKKRQVTDGLELIMK